MIDHRKINLLFLIYRKKFKQFNEEISTMLVPYKITMQHAVYIMALDTYGDMTIKDLNASVDNDGAITTRVIKTLKKHGYVEKLGSRIKKYKVALTSEGKKISKKIIEAMNMARKIYFKNLTQNEILLLADIAEKLS